MKAPLSLARDEMLLHLDYLADSAVLIEGFAQRAQANAGLVSPGGFAATSLRCSGFFGMLRRSSRSLRPLKLQPPRRIRRLYETELARDGCGLRECFGFSAASEPA